MQLTIIDNTNEYLHVLFLKVVTFFEEHPNKVTEEDKERFMGLSEHIQRENLITYH